MSFLRSLVTLTLILGLMASSNLFQNGFKELVLIVIAGLTGWFIWSEMPKRIREIIRKFFFGKSQELSVYLGILILTVFIGFMGLDVLQNPILFLMIILAGFVTDHVDLKFCK